MAIILGLGLGIPFILFLFCGYYFYDKKLKLEIEIEKNEVFGGEEIDSNQNNNIGDVTTLTPTPQFGEPELLWDGQTSKQRYSKVPPAKDICIFINKIVALILKHTHKKVRIVSL